MKNLQKFQTSDFAETKLSRNGSILKVMNTCYPDGIIDKKYLCVVDVCAGLQCIWYLEVVFVKEMNEI